MSNDRVATVCIPAYRAEAFIDRTLRCARTQTYEAQRILVSIDRSDDATEEICRSHQRDDDRIDIAVHAEQLGWVGNVNHLLDAVRSEYAFIYFHDDIIEPTYTERLVEALEERPDAASAHCDVVLDDGGDDQRLRPGCQYEGTATERLLTYFVTDERGALLRSMVRTSSPAGRLRMTFAGAAHEMSLVAAGPAVRVPEPLYRRWIERVGGLTVGLYKRPFDDLVVGLRHNAALARGVVDELQPSPRDRALLDFGLAVYLTNQLRTLEKRSGATVMLDLADVIQPAPSLEPPTAIDQLPAELQRAAASALGRVHRRTEKQARRAGVTEPTA